MHHLIAIGEFKLELQFGNAQLGSNSSIFRAVWPWNLTDDLNNNRAPLQCYFKLCASFHSRRWFQTGVTVQKRPIRVKIDDFRAVSSWNLTDDLKKQKGNIKPNASFHHHMWIQTLVTIRKPLSWVMTSVILTFDLWLCPFAWTLLWTLVITENFMMIRWWEHSQKGVTDGQTYGRTDMRTDGQKIPFIELLGRS